MPGDNYDLQVDIGADHPDISPESGRRLDLPDLFEFAVPDQQDNRRGGGMYRQCMAGVPGFQHGDDAVRSFVLP